MAIYPQGFVSVKQKEPDGICQVNVHWKNVFSYRFYKTYTNYRVIIQWALRWAMRR
jgi:hypothetical protein